MPPVFTVDIRKCNTLYRITLMINSQVFIICFSLHDKGTDMNLSDNDGRTALHAAVERNQEKVVEFLIDKCKVSPFQRWR